MRLADFALIKDNVVVNLIVLDLDAPFDPPFALHLTQFDEVVPREDIMMVEGHEVSPGAVREHAEAPFRRTDLGDDG